MKKKKLKKVSELSLLRRLAVKAIHRVQKVLLRLRLYKPYYALSKLHFKIYLRKNLVEEVAGGTYEGHAAAKRHARMVTRMFKKTNEDTKMAIYKASLNKFKKDLLLEARL